MKIQKYSFLIVVISVAAVFLQVVSFDFLKYDDTINVSENPLILNPSAEHLLVFWKSTFLGLYIPITYTVWSGLAAISLKIFSGRLDSGLFHLSNLIIHILNCLLVFQVILKLFSLKGRQVSESRIVMAAVFGALVFGLHPVQVESVSWITDLKGVLSGFFSLGAIYLYLLYYSAERKRFLFYCGSTGLLILAFLSKPSAVAVPFMLFFIVLWLDDRISAKVICSLILWGVVVLAVLMITRSAQVVAAGPEVYPWRIRLFVALDAMMFYARQLVWPRILAIDYCRTPAYVVSLSWRNPYWLMALPVAGLVYSLRRRKRWLVLGCAVAAGVMPVSGLLPFAYQETSTVADRYLYLPMTAVAVMAAAAIIFERPRPLIIGLCYLLVTVLGARSFYQCRVWQDTESVMRHTLQHYPCSFRANLNYGIALASRGDLAEAISYYQAARRLKADDPLSYYQLGLAYAGTGNDRKYEQMYEKLLPMDKDKAARLKRAAEAFGKINLSDAVGGRAGADGREKEEQP